MLLQEYSIQLQEFGVFAERAWATVWFIHLKVQTVLSLSEEEGVPSLLMAVAENEMDMTANEPNKVVRFFSIISIVLYFFNLARQVSNKDNDIIYSNVWSSPNVSPPKGALVENCFANRNSIAIFLNIQQM